MDFYERLGLIVFFATAVLLMCLYLIDKHITRD